MLLQREGFPEPGEFVICTVTNIQQSSVFVRINEYGRTGFIHISEISPGRIRNIRDYVSKGRVIICLVLKIDEEKGYIDLSLRRVNDHEKRKKQEKIKQEQKAEKLIEQIAQELKKPVEEVYKAIATPIFEKFEYVGDAFYHVIDSKEDFAALGVPKAYADVLTTQVREKIKPKEVCIRGALKVQSFAPDGVDVVRKVLESGIKGHTLASITYLGGGKYKLMVKAKDYKKAEKDLKEITEHIERDIEGQDGTFSFARQETGK